MEPFHWTLKRKVLGCFRQLGVSLSLCYWCWFVLSGPKALSGMFLACISTGKRKQSTSLWKEPIVPSGRNQALVSFSDAGALWWPGKGGEGKARRVCHALVVLYLLQYVSLLVPSFFSFLLPLFTRLITPGHVCYPKLMGNCPRDGPVATFCFPLSTSNEWRPSHHVGMLMWAALGLTQRDASLQQVPAAKRGENWALTPGCCQFEEVT